MVFIAVPFASMAVTLSHAAEVDTSHAPIDRQVPSSIGEDSGHRNSPPSKSSYIENSRR